MIEEEEESLILLRGISLPFKNKKKSKFCSRFVRTYIDRDFDLNFSISIPFFFFLFFVSKE